MRMMRIGLRLCTLALLVPLQNRRMQGLRSKQQSFLALLDLGKRATGVCFHPCCYYLARFCNRNSLRKYFCFVANLFCIFRSIRRERLLQALALDTDDVEDAQPPSAAITQAAAVKKLPAWLALEQPLASPSHPPDSISPPPDSTTPAAPSSPLSPSQFFSPGHPGQRSHAPSHQEAVDMYFLRGFPASSAGVVQMVVSRLDAFPLLKLGRNGVAEMRTIFFSADGSELLWKGNRGTCDVFPIRKLLGVSLDFSPDHAEDPSITKLHQTRLSFLLQFSHRSITLAARSEHERCMFVAGVLCLRDQAVGCSAGREMWDDIAPLLFQTQAALQQQQQQLSAHAAPTGTTRVADIMGQSLLLNAAQSTQRSALCIPNATVGGKSAAGAASASHASLIEEMTMQKRVVCALSDDIVIDCRVQLRSDGSVLVLRDAPAHKDDGALELVRSSFFEVSLSGIESHVWMSEVTACMLHPFSRRVLLNDTRRSSRRIGCMFAKAAMEWC